MIDFDKPMRVKGGPEMRFSLTDARYVGVIIQQKMCAVDVNGEVFPLGASFGRHLENIQEPRRRYQAQYEDGTSGVWIDKEAPVLGKPIAWLIETDHGGDASPRWTYEREDVK